MTPVWHSRQRYLPHHAYAGLHGFRECGSGKPFPFSLCFALVIGFLTIFLLLPQVIARVRNLMRQCTQQFYWLEAAKTMRVYIAHNMKDSEDLHVRLEMEKSEVTIARKLTEEGVDLLKRVEEEKEATQAKAHRLVEKNETMEVGKKKAEGETGRLSQELEELWTRFAIQKEELEAEYQKQVDNMFFYGYHYCMKKHGIAQDTPRVSSDEEKEVVSGPARGEGDASGADPFSGRA